MQNKKKIKNKFKIIFKIILFVYIIKCQEDRIKFQNECGRQSSRAGRAPHSGPGSIRGP